MTSCHERETLVLSREGDPLGIVSVWRACKLLKKNVVCVVREHEGGVHTTTLVFRLPSVVRLLRHIPWRSRGVRFTRINVFARDDFRCQYCERQFRPEHLTFDHVIPRSVGGATSWDNIVTACSPCNLRKANRTPDEAGMRLRAEPIEPTWVPAVSVQLKVRRMPSTWHGFIEPLPALVAA